MIPTSPHIAFSAMIRAFFFTCGLFVALCGGLLLFLDRVILTEYGSRHLRDATGPIATAEPVKPGSPWRFVSAAREIEESPRTVVDPPDWLAFGLLSVGCVTVLYALALPGRRSDEEDEE